MKKVKERSSLKILHQVLLPCTLYKKYPKTKRSHYFLGTHENHTSVLMIKLPISINFERQKSDITQVSSMIHLSRPVVNIVFSDFSLQICFVLLDFEKWGRTYGRTPRVKTMITTGPDIGSTMWINYTTFLFTVIVWEK